MPPLVTGFLATAVVVAGIVWQAFVFQRDGDNDGQRHVVAAVISGLVILGAIGYSIFAVFDPRVEIGFLGGIKLVGTSFVVAVLFWIKQALGPLLLSVMASWTAYVFLQHGELDMVPVISWLLDMLFSAYPSWVGQTYIWFTVIYGLVGSLLSSVDYFGH
ncbi:MAG: hypothetical protein JNJ83_13595 [Verrucomicrobiaceae bacterium]|nr:hypothetical protein [Verrucomicrobiaceae bacterium]